MPDRWLRFLAGSSLLQRQAEAARTINPRRVYPRNVAAFFHIPHRAAEWLLEMAVREGWMAKRVGLLNPEDGRMIISVPEDGPFPEVVHDDVAEAEEHQSEFALDELDRQPFYVYSPG